MSLNELIGKTFFTNKPHQFIGEDGSLGFKTGQTYLLTMRGIPIPDKRLNNAKLLIYTNNGMSCPYSNRETFEQNWKEVSK